MFSARQNLSSLVSSALTRLTLIYTVILMTVSLIFSIGLYQVSVREMELNFNTQINIIRQRPNLRALLDERTDWIDEQLEELEESKNRVKSRLVLVNIVILGGSVLLSYLLAKRTLEPIEEAHGTVVRFTADASHELRTPITSMQTEIEVALRDPKLKKSEAIDILRSNLSELKRMGILSDNLLKLARGSQPNVSIKPTNLQDVIKKAIETVRPQAKLKSIKISAPKTGLSAKADKDLLQETLVIIIENAVKYSDDKSNVQIITKKHSRVASISITDKGRGISKEEQSRIFERFYRGDSSRSTDGFGLGLSLAHQMVATMGGEISVSSAKGKGSTFTIKLPS
ncbi:MAG: HAMP domain-containing sensor histidine kinase [Patescibacteria group bacterium]